MSVNHSEILIRTFIRLALKGGLHHYGWNHCLLLWNLQSLDVRFILCYSSCLKVTSSGYPQRGMPLRKPFCFCSRRVDTNHGDVTHILLKQCDVR